MSKRKNEKSAKGKKKTTPKSKPKEQIRKSAAVPNGSLDGSLSLVIPCYNEEANADRMASAVKRLQQKLTAEYIEVVLVDDCSTDGTLKALNNAFSGMPEDRVKIIAQEKNGGKGKALVTGVDAATGDYILTLDADMASEPVNIVSWLNQLPGKSFPEDTVLIGSREHEQSDIVPNTMRKIVGLIFNFVVRLFTNLPLADTQCGFKLYPKEIAKSLFGKLKQTGWAHDVELLYAAQLDGYGVKSMPVKWEHKEDSKISVFKDGIAMFLQTIGISSRLRFKHFISDPIKNFSLSPGKSGEPSYYRLLFTVCSILLLVLMPLLSFDYGITGDEEVQKIYGEKVLAYFESGGENKEALNYENLYFYGGLFDYTAAWLNQNIGGLDPWDMRHLLNSLFGFLLILFTGFAAKEMSGSWRVAFFALIFMALSPRIFGHSMNNPKDIPFAMANAFTLLYLIRYVKELPTINPKTIAMLIVGIALAINMRVGGVLSIAYLGVGTVAALLFNAEFRNKLKDMKYLLKLGFVLGLVAFLGYLGGLLFWPYGWEKPFENPMKALSEMGDFSTAIRLLFSGDHYWSDALPWFYIPKWFLISTPIFILLGVAAYFAFAIKAFKGKGILVHGALLFTGLFPPIYAIVTDAPIYDGIRHFLFIYPSFVILSAWAWHKLVSFSDKPAMRWGASGLLGILMVPVIIWMFRSHPNQYVYFNETVGGLKGAYTNYETDYWMNSAKEATLWLLENDPKIQAGETVNVKTNCIKPVREYIKRYSDVTKVKPGYYAFRDRVDWTSTYDIFISRFVNREHMLNGVFPAEPVVHTVEVAGVPLATISKREEPYDAQAMVKMRERDFAGAISLFEAEIKQHPKNESAMIALGQCYLQTQNIQGAKRASDMALALSGTDINTLLLAGNVARSSGQDDKAVEIFEKVRRLSYKEKGALTALGSLYAKKGRATDAMDALASYGAQGGQDANVFRLGLQLATQSNDNLYKAYFEAQNMLRNPQNGKTDVNGIFSRLDRALQIKPDFEPASELKELLEKELEKQRNR